MIARGDWNGLLTFDQLLSAIERGNAFDGFLEHRIGFAPTYKFVTGNENENDSAQSRNGRDSVRDYDWKRTPSYTDRVLWKLNRTENENKKRQMKVRCLSYDSLMAQCVSDHKPVV